MHTMKTQLLFIFLLSLAFLLPQKTNAQVAKKILAAGDKKIAIYDFNNFEKRVNQKNDTTYIVNFWATWCIPCVQELPYFEQLQEKYKSEKIKVILVSLDFPKQVEKSLIPFIKKKKLTSEVILLDAKNPNAWINKVDPSWSGALPATLILNKKHRYFFEKSFNFEELENEYLELTKRD